jgi:hypothetical protein
MNKTDVRLVACLVVTGGGMDARYSGISALFRAIRVLTFELSTD